MHKRLIAVLPFILSGCASSLSGRLGQEAQVVVYPRFSRNALSVVDANTLASIATLSVFPYRETATDIYAPVDSAGAVTSENDPARLKLSMTAPIVANRPFVITRLKPNQKYRFIARAYNASNVQISLDASSSVDLAVQNNDAPSMAALPVALSDTPFGATLAVNVATGASRYDYLKFDLYRQGALLTTLTSARKDPQLSFSNLQANTAYKLVGEAYKLGGMLASTSVDIPVGNDNALATADFPLTVPFVSSSFVGSVAGAQNGASPTFNTPYRVAVDAQGNVYVADRGNSLIRKITPAGVASTLAGTGATGYADGTGTAAAFNNPNGLAVDSSGNVYVADYVNHRIRKVTSSGVVTTLAGNGSTGLVDGTGAAAKFWSPYGLKLDAAGNLYVSDRDNHAIRKVTPAGVVMTLAGCGAVGTADGQGAQATFYMPHGLGVDAQGNVFVCDTYNNRIRKITPSGVVTTIAGTGTGGRAEGTIALLDGPRDLTVDTAGNVYLADMGNNRICLIATTGMFTTIAGGTAAGSSDGTGTAARFNNPTGIDIDMTGCLYIADPGNQRIKKIQ